MISILVSHLIVISMLINLFFLHRIDMNLSWGGMVWSWHEPFLIICIETNKRSLHFAVYCCIIYSFSCREIILIHKEIGLWSGLNNKISQKLFEMYIDYSVRSTCSLENDKQANNQFTYTWWLKAAIRFLFLCKKRLILK